MKKGFRTLLLLSACLVLLAGCASEPKTQYNVNTQGAANTSGTNTAGSSLPADYDPASEEDDYTGDAASPPEEIPLPTPVVIDPIDKPTPTPLPALSFTYQTYTASNLNLTFEGPAGWVVDTSEANSYKLQSPDWATGYAATLVIRANSTSIEYTTDSLTTEVKSMLTNLRNANYPKFSPSNTATRKGLFLGATGVYANYTATLDGNLQIAGRIAAVYKNNVLYTVHLTYPAGYTDTYKTNVYDKLRDTLKIITAQ